MKRKKKKWGSYIILFLICTFLWLNYIGNKVSNKMVDVVIMEINNKINKYIFDSISMQTSAKLEFDKIIKLSKNKNDEIVSIDYNLSEVYKILGESLNDFYKNVTNISFDVNYQKGKKKDIIWIPLGIGSKNILVANFGPRIPIKLNLLMNTTVNYKTKVKAYGINSILVELYLVVKVDNSLTTFVTQKNFSKNYEALVASRVIQGTVPEAFYGALEKNSPIINS